jgi:polyisoprenoid-binding protein YceI
MMRCRTALLVTASVATAGPAAAQARWTVDGKSSLAWWQISPHMNHLWATTCPQEPSWRPGEGRSGGWSIAQWLTSPVAGDLSVADTVNVPLYPRYEARDICSAAVQGEVVAPDTLTWRGLQGNVTVQAERLMTGHSQRDAFTRDKILETSRYPEIRFAIDSLTAIGRSADTLSATAYGVLSLHGVDKPMHGPVRAWPEGGGLRVMGRFRIPASAITHEFGMSTVALGLGIGVRIWQDLFMGVDLLMRQQAPGEPEEE